MCNLCISSRPSRYQDIKHFFLNHPCSWVSVFHKHQMVPWSIAQPVMWAVSQQSTNSWINEGKKAAGRLINRHIQWITWGYVSNWFQIMMREEASPLCATLEPSPDMSDYTLTDPEGRTDHANLLTSELRCFAVNNNDVSNDSEHAMHKDDHTVKRTVCDRPISLTCRSYIVCVYQVAPATHSQLNKRTQLHTHQRGRLSRGRRKCGSCCSLCLYSHWQFEWTLIGHVGAVCKLLNLWRPGGGAPVEEVWMITQDGLSPTRIYHTTVSLLWDNQGQLFERGDVLLKCLFESFEYSLSEMEIDCCVAFKFGSYGW